MISFWDEKARTVAEALRDSLLHKPVRVSVIDGANASSFRSCIEKDTVVACVAIVSREALGQASFVDAVNRCCDKVFTQSTFRFFVHLMDVSFGQLIAIQALDTEKGLIDTVHVPERPDDYGQTRGALQAVQAYIDALPDLRDHIRFQRLEKLGVTLFRAATLVVAVAVIGGLAILTVEGETAREQSLFPWITLVVSLPISLWAIILLSLINVSPARPTPLIAIGLTVFPLWLVVVVPINSVVQIWPYMLVGVWIGLVWQALWRKWGQEGLILKQTAEKFITSEARRSAFHPLGWSPGRRHLQLLINAPLLAKEAKVFLSYTRQADEGSTDSWGKKVAVALHQALSKESVPCFLDTSDIAAGVSWRHKLLDAMRKASVVVSVQNKTSIKKKWPKTELLAAARNQVACGIPLIIVLRHENLTEAMVREMSPELLPIIFPTEDADPRLLRVIECGAQAARYTKTTTTLARGLSGYLTSPLLGSDLAFVLSWMLLPFQVSLAALGTLGTVAGCLSLIIWGLIQTSDGVSGWLSANPSVPMIAAPLLGFWLGFVTRLALASRFELFHIRSQPQAWLQVLAAVGLVLLLSDVLFVQSMLLALATVGFGAVGWMLCSDFVTRTLPIAGAFRVPPNI